MSCIRPEPPPWWEDQTMRRASPELLCPVNGMHEHTKRILAQPLGITRRLDNNSEYGAPTFGPGKASALVAALGPSYPEAIRRCPDHTGDLDRHLDLMNLAEGIDRSSIVVEGGRTFVGDEVVGREPILANDNGIGRERAYILDKTRKVPGDLRIGRTIVGSRGRNRLCLAELVDLYYPRRDGAAGGLPDQANRQASGQ